MCDYENKTFEIIISVVHMNLQILPLLHIIMLYSLYTVTYILYIQVLPHQFPELGNKSEGSGSVWLYTANTYLW